MDGLDEFEKTLAAEKAERERSERDREERRHRKHRHRHDGDGDGDRERDRDRDRDRDRHRDRDGDRDGHRHRRHRDDNDDEHRHKRSRHSRDDDEHRSRHRHRDDRHGHKSSDPREDLPAPDAEKPASEDTVERSKPQARDAWMTAPSSLDVDYVHRPDKNARSPSPKPEPKRIVSKREINAHIREGRTAIEQPEPPKERTIDYTFGDASSSWRMTKLRAVYTAAEEGGRSIEEVAMERFGNLQDFDDAREEKEEMDRRRLYGKGYSGKEKPTGDLYKERLQNQKKNEPPPPPPVEEAPAVQQEALASGPVIDQTALNRMRAQMMKAKLRRAPNAAQLEEEYSRAAAAFAKRGADDQAVVLGVMDNRQLAGTRNEAKAVNTARGRERGTVEENTDMSIEDMVREERRTKTQAGGEGMRLAERIAKDTKYDNDLEYMNDNAEKLAKRVHKSEINLKNMAVNEFQKMQRILDSCPLCHHEDKDQPPLAPVVSLGTRVFLTLATEPEVSPGGVVIAPISHRKNLLECDDDEWEEIRNFMKSLTRMYHDQGRDVVFYENAAAPQHHLHAAMVAVPIPYEEGATAPAYFREAFLSSDEEWSQHQKVVDTDKRAREGMGRAAFRRSFAKEAPYFHVWFSLDGGMGHVVEDSGRWPKGDLFAREVIGGIVDAEPHIIKKQGRWTRIDPRLDGFKKGWRKFDWTRMLADG